MTAIYLVALAAVGLLMACVPPAAQGGAAPGATALVCAGDISEASPNVRKEYDSFKRRVETGPFYRALGQRLGSPRSCRHSVQSGGLRLAYSFPSNGTLVVQIDPRIEFSEERLNLRGLTETDAKALLQAGEAATFGAQGCGILWQRPAIEGPATVDGSREVVYRGDVCNCQARVVYNGVTVMALILRSAC